LYKGIVIGNINVCKFMIMLSFISVHVEFSRMYLTFYKLLLNIAVACMWGSENKKKLFCCC